MRKFACYSLSSFLKYGRSRRRVYFGPRGKTELSPLSVVWDIGASFKK